MMVTPPHKALFLDRDGVVIDYVPYLGHPEQVALPPKAAPALKKWQEAGFLLILITNQAGIGRGYFTLADMEAVHTKMRALYRAWGVEFVDIFYCPHHPQEQCVCRKPSPYLLLKAAQKHHIALAESYFLGDAPSDLEAAIAAGCQPLLVLTGRGKETQSLLPQISAPIPIFADVAATTVLLTASPGEAR
jgi:D-glycero-D-manno-heptose 1,7-bisphosphate phosphatase